MSFQILQRAYAPYGTAAQFPASGDSRLIYRATDTGYLYTWDASESAYKLAGIDPATAPYLGLHAQADDAARLGGQLPSYYAQASHVHTFAGLTSKPTTLAGYGITDAAAASHTHSGYETAIGNPSADGYLLSSTSAGVRSWVAPYAHPATHAQSVIDSSTGWITTALAGKQAAGAYLTTTGTAADSAKLGGQLPSYYAQAGHVHNYAGSSTPGGAATTALACTGNAATATTAASCTGNSATATTASSCSGNSATATALATASLINGTSFNGSSDVIVSKIYDANYARIQNPGGGAYVSTTYQQTGAIAVQLPVGMTYTMCCITVKVYDYATGKSFEIHVCGYNSSGDNYWRNYTAYIIGNPNTDRQYTVRLGYDSTAGKAMVYIGELSSVWDFPQVYVTEVLCGFSGYSEAWTSGWQIGFEEVAFKNVTATIADCQVGYRPQNAFTGTKVIGGTSCTFVNGLLVS